MYSNIHICALVEYFNTDIGVFVADLNTRICVFIVYSNTRIPKRVFVHLAYLQMRRFGYAHLCICCVLEYMCAFVAYLNTCTCMFVFHSNKRICMPFAYSNTCICVSITIWAHILACSSCVPPHEFVFDKYLNTRACAFAVDVCAQ